MDFSGLIKDVKEEIGFGLLPSGEYEVVIESVDLKQSSSGGKYLNFKLKVLSGEYSKRILFDSVNVFVPSSDQATNIGLARLKKISNLTGVMQTELMIGKRLLVDVSFKKDSQYGDKNYIKQYIEGLSVNQSKENSSPKTAITIEDIPF